MSNFYVTCYDFYIKKGYLILGDEFGNISVWNVRPLAAMLDILQGGPNQLPPGEILKKLIELDKKTITKGKDKDSWFQTQIGGV